MNSQIINHQTVYYEELISRNLFRSIYKQEKVLPPFNINIILCNRSFFCIPVQIRKKYHLYPGDIIIFRLCYENKVAELISKVYTQGKIHLPNKIIRALNLNNHQIIPLNLIPTDTSLNPHISKTKFDLFCLNEGKLKVLKRNNEYATIFYSGKKAITLKRIIPLNKDVVELFYLIHGDGHYKNKFYFINKDSGLLKFVIKTFKDYFSLTKDIWKARILIFDLENESKAKEYWIKELNLSKEQFYNSSKTELHTCELGNLRIIIDRTIFSLIFQKIFLEIQKIEDPGLNLSAVNGIINAEGSAERSTLKGSHKVSISFNKKELHLFETALIRANINYKKTERFLIISSWLNQYYFLKIFYNFKTIPFSNHQHKRNNLILGFLDHRYTKTLNRYLSKLNNPQLLFSDFVKNLNVRRDSARELLQKNRYKIFIKLEGTHNANISITSEGLEFQKLINWLEEIKDK